MDCCTVHTYNSLESIWSNLPVTAWAFFRTRYLRYDCIIVLLRVMEELPRFCIQRNELDNLLWLPWSVLFWQRFILTYLPTCVVYATNVYMRNEIKLNWKYLSEFKLSCKHGLCWRNKNHGEVVILQFQINFIFKRNKFISGSVFIMWVAVEL